LSFQRTYPPEPFLSALAKALAYGLFDLSRLDKMILEHVAGDFFRIPDEHD
jgi:hypothetical protein